MSGHTVVIITAANCGACKGIKSKGVYDKIITGLQSSGYAVKKVELNFMGENYQSSSEFDTFIKNRLYSWYPFMAIVSNSDINDLVNGRITQDELFSRIRVFNGVKQGNKIEMTKEYKFISPEYVLEWAAKYSREIDVMKRNRGNINRNSIAETHTNDREVRVIISDDVPSLPSGGSRQTFSGSTGSITDEKDFKADSQTCSNIGIKIAPRYYGGRY